MALQAAAGRMQPPACVFGAETFIVNCKQHNNNSTRPPAFCLPSTTHI